MSNNIPTAEEFLDNYRFKAGEHIGNRDLDTIVQYAKDFAKIHVLKALEAARNNVEFSGIWGEFDVSHFNEISVSDLDGDWIQVSINKDSISNAYPIENIK